MEKKIKRVRIVGKGHASCFERLLLEWYRNESCRDVIFTCYASNGELEDRDPLRQISANRSILAAASPVFANIFLENPIVEEDVQVTLAGYSHRAISAVIQYVYTGSIEFDVNHKDEIEDMLKDFQIHVPNASVEPIDMLDIVYENPTVREPLIAKKAGLKIISAVSLATTNINILRKPSKTPTEVTEIIPVPQNPVAAIHQQIRPSENLVDLPDPLAPDKVQQPVIKKKILRILSRTVDAPPVEEKSSTLDPLQLDYSLSGLCKSFLEKSVSCSESVYMPPLQSATIAGGKLRFSRMCEDMAQNDLYRRIINGFHDVPGIYTLYRERGARVPHVPIYNPLVSSIPSNLYVPSYLEKKPDRTYQGGAKRKRKVTIPQPVSSLAGLKIESVRQCAGKLHIRTAGEPLTNKASEDLYDDYPISFIAPEHAASRVIVEHNYSFGEGNVIDEDDQESSNRSELAADQEDYKRSIQLVIIEQRRKSRLTTRYENMNEEAAILKRRAIKLLKICNTMKEEAHELLPQPEKPPQPVQKPKPVIAAPPEPKVPCDVCSKLVKKSWLKRHMVIAHSQERNHLCEECGRTFVLKGQLQAHKLRQHRMQPGNHVCDQCGRSFRFIRYLRRHMSFHSPTKPHVCRFCDKGFRLKAVLIKHVRTHTGEKPYKCVHCTRCFRQRTTYARHLQVHEKRRESGVVESNEAGLEAPPRLKCDFCSMTFRLDLFLMLHRAKHTGETPALPCPSCTSTFPSIKELTLHRKSQHPDTVFSCQLCPKVFTNKTNFEFHVYKHSNPDAVKKKYPKQAPVDTGPCTCDFCDKVFKSRSALDYHIKGIHLGNRSMKCPHCEKTFSHKPTLEQHVRTHTGERPFKCDQCSSSFKQQQHLTAHMVVHTGERPFKCQHCEKSFPHKTTLYAHLRIHTGKRLICSYCKKVMPSVTQLMRHEEACPMNAHDSSSAE